MFVYDKASIAWALRELETGRSPRAVSEALGASLRTVKRWRAGGTPAERAAVPGLPEPEGHARRVAPEYSYLLGLYLGDGHLVEMRRQTWALRISLDGLYEGIVEEARRTMIACRGRGTASVRQIPNTRGVLVVSYSKLWPSLFPQHGPGKKHLRDVSLKDWQVRLTKNYPRELVRGLIHSDGSRFVARQKADGRMYQYPRYTFENRSAHIIDIFTAHLDLLGVSWTAPRGDSVQIARRDAVARLDTFVGPKR